MTDPYRHASQPKLISRLKRAEGHLRSVGAMIEERRPRRDVATQLQAVESIIRNATPALIHDHVDQRLDAEGLRPHLDRAHGHDPVPLRPPCWTS